MADDEDWDTGAEQVQKLSLGDDDDDEAVVAARAAVEADGSSVAASVALGVALLESGDEDAAVEELRRAVGLDAASAEAQYALGRALKASDEPAEARKAFEAAVKADGAHAEALYALGQTLLGVEQKSEEEALDYFKRSSEANARHTGAASQAGKLLLSAGRGAEAAVYFAKAAEVDPSDGNVRASLVQAYDQSGDFKAWTDARNALHTDAAAGKINTAFVAFNQYCCGQFEANGRFVMAFDHLKGDTKFAFRVYNKGEVHDSKVLKTLGLVHAAGKFVLGELDEKGTVSSPGETFPAEPGFGEIKAKVSGLV